MLMICGWVLTLTGALGDRPELHQGWLLAQGPSTAVVDRELTIRALHDEITELRDEKSGIGFVFPSLCIGAGVGAVFGGLALKLVPLWIAGAVVGGLSVIWLITRIARAIWYSNKIGEREDQLDALSAQRVSVSIWVGPGTGSATLAYNF